MDEQTHDSELATQSAVRQAAPEAGEVQPDSFLELQDPPTEKPVGWGSAALLVGIGALVIIGVFALLMSLNPTLNPAIQQPPAAVVAGDDFAVVRQKADAGFQRGKTAFEQGKFDQALIELDQASMNDPDKRQDIQDLLRRTVDAIRQRDQAQSAPVVAGTPAPAGPAPTVGPREGFDSFADDANGVALLVPHGWSKTASPQSEVGQGVVQFADPSGATRFTIARDMPAQPISPELYAATIETRMQSLPGYASEQVQMTSVGMLPAVKRLFSLNGKSPSGKESSVRALQTVIGHGRTMFVLTAESGTSQFDGFKPQFQTMTDSFRAR
jgi:hypothetical protein